MKRLRFGDILEALVLPIAAAVALALVWLWHRFPY